MLAFHFFLVVLYFILGPVWSDTPATSGEGILNHGCGIVPFPANVSQQCCTAEYKCNMFIGGNENKYGLTNSRDQPKRGCECERKFAGCLLVNLPPRQVARTIFSFYRQQCIREQQCNASSATPCERYKFVAIGSIIYDNEE